MVESPRIRTTKSKAKTRQDHIANQGQVSMSHYNMVHKPTFQIKSSGHSKLAPKIGLQSVEVSKDFGSVNFQIHRKAVFMLLPPTKVTRTTSIMEPLTDTINMPKCSKQVHQPQHNHVRTDPGLKKINHGKVLDKILVGDIHKICGTHHQWRWLPQYQRIIHRRKMDTTDTLGEHHDPHNIYSKQFVSFLCCCEPLFFSMSTRAQEYFATSAGSKQKVSSLLRTHCEKNADMDYRAVPPPEYQAGGDSKREDLCQQDSDRVIRTTPGASSSGQLEAAGVSSSRRPVATEEPSTKKNVHLHPDTEWRKYIKKFDDPANNLVPQSEEKHEVYNHVLEIW